MYKSLIIIIPLLLSACSDSYEEHLDKNKTRLASTNIEIRLPKMLEQQDWDFDLYKTKDKGLSLNVSTIDKDYQMVKDIVLPLVRSGKNPDTVESHFVPESTDPDIDDYELHGNPEEGPEYISYEKKFGVDGSISLRFNIKHNDNEAIRNKLAGIAKASLNTVSHSHKPVDMTEGLKHQAGQIDGMTIGYRNNQQATYYKNNLGISVKYAPMPSQDTSTDSPNLFGIEMYTTDYLDAGYVYSNEDSNCKKFLTESTEHISISNRKVEKKILTQKCKKHTYKAIRTEIPTKANSIFSIDMTLPADIDHQPFHAYYNEFLKKITIPSAEK